MRRAGRELGPLTIRDRSRVDRYGPCVRIGLTGGIGSGKSTVSALLAERGAVIVDADRIAREVVEPGTAGLAAVAEAFGDGVLAPDGTLDRPALAAVVFADPQARARLDGIVHPLVRARAAELEAAVPAGAVVVHDVPLLVETGQAAAYDLVLVVAADAGVRVARLGRRPRALAWSHRVPLVQSMAGAGPRRWEPDHDRRPEPRNTWRRPAEPGPRPPRLPPLRR